MRFTPGELKVMTLLWDHGELTPPQLMDLYPEDIKDPALRSYLKILVEKGHVSRRREGKAFVYQAITAKRNAFGGMMKQLAEAFGDGSLRSLMLNLAQHEKLSEADLAEIRAAAGLDGQHEAAPKRTAKKRSKKARRKQL
ncbi:BlaI/MecI/CopY family transcriptional regulator [Stieleria sp. JC731]|uniref:BlaI/MecI/CopY family transcriptional regulator n=1 Tax=Pirellulaceae TaxID=2691357 RepID=UPI001E328733|nr:BlaI/MecI/CopY family transcriptional regulator [Stieleria sp. JC731]MCC9598929.1 BlaI/MecI/CopY family transcriptional regulator [Stieleria sp. JC731]